MVNSLTLNVFLLFICVPKIVRHFKDFIHGITMPFIMCSAECSNVVLCVSHSVWRHSHLFGYWLASNAEQNVSHVGYCSLEATHFTFAHIFHLISIQTMYDTDTIRPNSIIIYDNFDYETSLPFDFTRLCRKNKNESAVWGASLKWHVVRFRFCRSFTFAQTHILTVFW